MPAWELQQGIASPLEIALIQSLSALQRRCAELERRLAEQHEECCIGQQLHEMTRH